MTTNFMPNVVIETPSIQLVRGIMPGSKNEWFTALALDKLKLEYWFQYAIGGGRNVRGGQVVDFVVFNPRATPVFVQGAYWHNQAHATEDQIKQAAASNYFRTPVVLLLEEETDTLELALAAVKKKLMV